MSRLDDLITELCPYGVEYVELEQVSNIKAGQNVSKNFIQRNPGKYPVINSGVEPLGYVNTYNTKHNEIGITSRGAGVGFVSWTEGKFFRGNLNYGLDILEGVTLDKRFLYHVLLASKYHIESLCVFSGIPALNASNLKKLRIPLPPLPIQEEIVRVLDHFTALTAGLTAELTARQKQYEYYRDELLTFRDEVVWKTLGEVCFYPSDRTEARNIDETNYVGVDNLLQDKRGITLSNYAPTAGTLIEYLERDVLIGNIRPYLRKIWFATNSGGTNGDVLVLRIKQENTNVLTPRFLYHLLASEAFFHYNIRHSRGAKMPRGDKQAIMKYRIPLPPIAEQQRIVDILDHFDTLVNDLTSGLPAEIEARRKQHDYYRDKLLTFKEIS